MVRLVRTHDDGAPFGCASSRSTSGTETAQATAKGTLMFFDIDLTVRAAVAREREMQRAIAETQAQDEQN